MIETHREFSPKGKGVEGGAGLVSRGRGEGPGQQSEQTSPPWDPKQVVLLHPHPKLGIWGWWGESWRKTLSCLEKVSGLRDWGWLIGENHHLFTPGFFGVLFWTPPVGKQEEVSAELSTRTASTFSPAELPATGLYPGTARGLITHNLRMPTPGHSTGHTWPFFSSF